MIPTEDQVRELWEWCGWKKDIDSGIYYYKSKVKWIPPDSKDADDFLTKPPPIDLTSLFEYAVPKLNGRYKLEGTGGYHFATVWKDVIAYVEVRDTDPALALFWAIWEVIRWNE